MTRRLSVCELADELDVSECDVLEAAADAGCDVETDEEATLLLDNESESGARFAWLTGVDLW